jgi:hypothetical protein
MAAKAKPPDESEKFLGILEGGVKAVLKDATATAGERVAAITAGAKLLAIRHKISDGDQKGFFDS